MRTINSKKSKRERKVCKRIDRRSLPAMNRESISFFTPVTFDRRTRNVRLRRERIFSSRRSLPTKSFGDVRIIDRVDTDVTFLSSGAERVVGANVHTDTQTRRRRRRTTTTILHGNDRRIVGRDVFFGRRITGIWASREISRETDSSSSLVNEKVFSIGRLPTVRWSPLTIDVLRYRSSFNGISRYKRRKCATCTLHRFANETCSMAKRRTNETEHSFSLSCSVVDSV